MGLPTCIAMHMDAQPGLRYRALNQRAQPLELHCGARVVVVPPHGEVELSAEEIASPQLLQLRHIAYLEILPAAAETPPVSQSKPQKQAKSSEGAEPAAQAPPPAKESARAAHAKRTQSKRKTASPSTESSNDTK